MIWPLIEIDDNTTDETLRNIIIRWFKVRAPSMEADGPPDVCDVAEDCYRSAKRNPALRSRLEQLMIALLKEQVELAEAGGKVEAVEFLFNLFRIQETFGFTDPAIKDLLLRFEPFIACLGASEHRFGARQMYRLSLATYEVRAKAIDYGYWRQLIDTGNNTEAEMGLWMIFRLGIDTVIREWPLVEKIGNSRKTECLSAYSLELGLDLLYPKTDWGEVGRRHSLTDFKSYREMLEVIAEFRKKKMKSTRGK